MSTCPLFLALAVVLYPLYFIAIASFSDPALVNAGKVLLLPAGITFEGYGRILAHAELWNGYRNTTLYTALGTLINVSLTLTAGYALSRRDLVGRSLITRLLVFTMLFQGA